MPWRLVLVPSGLLLFVSAFLPAVESVAPYEIGAFPPYALGLIAAAFAIAGPRARGAIAIAARVVLWLSAAAVVIAVLRISRADPVWPWVAVAIAALAGVCIVMGWEARAPDDLTAAHLTITAALIASALFGLWLLHDVDYGLHVSAAASLALVIGGLEWRREILRDRAAFRFPAALARRARSVRRSGAARVRMAP